MDKESMKSSDSKSGSHTKKSSSSSASEKSVSQLKSESLLAVSSSKVGKRKGLGVVKSFIGKNEMNTEKISVKGSVSSKPKRNPSKTKRSTNYSEKIFFEKRKQDVDPPKSIFDKENKLYPNPLSIRQSNMAKIQRISLRATKRIIAPYVKARQRPIATIKKREENKYFSFYIEKKPSILMTDLSKFLADSVDLLSVLSETGDVLKESINATDVSVYMVDESLNEIYQIPRISLCQERHRICWKIQTGSTVAAYAAFYKEYVIVDDVLEDDRFPEALGHSDITVRSVLCVPIVTPDDECLAVIELWRNMDLPPFDEQQLCLVVVVSGWIGSAIFQNQQRLALQRQQELNEYLLDLTKCYFADTMLLDKLITEMVNFAKTALSAEHGAFYVVKKKYDKIYADCYEEGLTEDSAGNLYKKKVLIQLEENDIAGFVAHQGKTLNIKNAAVDSNFVNIKKDTYIIKSILSMPIMGIDDVLGVIQVINKKRGSYFTKTDELLFETFTSYCAFALQFNRLFEKMSKTTNLNYIYLDMLEHHMQPCIHDMNEMLENQKLPAIPEGFTEFYWYLPDEDNALMPQLVIHMFTDLCPDIFTSMKQMVAFTLTVRKSYHNRPYHNFKHAFTVMNCIYNILRRNRDIFTDLEIKALMVASVCHDIDHYGVTNNYLTYISHNLAQLYDDDSVLENHHYHVTMIIIKDLQLFSGEHYTTDMYKTLVIEIRDAIIATDLMKYFKKKQELFQLFNDDSFDWDRATHRTLLKSIMMTTSDLSGQCKPFQTAKQITDLVYQEFYAEGDRQKALGYFPLSIMDRAKQHMVPNDQVQFLTLIVLPCVFLLTNFLPNCEELYKLAINLTDMWQEILDSQDVRVWKHESVDKGC